MTWRYFVAVVVVVPVAAAAVEAVGGRSELGSVAEFDAASLPGGKVQHRQTCVVPECQVV